jgi:hypothetical protein
MRLRALCFLTAVFLPTVAWATVTVRPQIVEITPPDLSERIVATVTGDGVRILPSGELTILGLPPGARSLPANPDYGPVDGRESQGIFRIYADATTVPGSYPITVRAEGLGETTFTLIIRGEAAFNAVASPNPVTLTPGGTQNVTVATTVSGNPGAITYTFTGLPGSITFGAPQTTDASSGYGPLVFPFTAAPGTPPGTYVGLLMGTAGSTTKSWPFTVIVQRPAITSTFLNPGVSLCNDGTLVSNALVLQPTGGYTGTPTITPINIPAGISITPNVLNAPALPPAATIPFSISSTTAAPGTYPIQFRISDPAAGIDQTATFNATVIASDYVPLVTGPSTIVAGQTAQYIASATAVGCFSAPITVSVTGAPAGVSILATVGTLQPPSYGPLTITIQTSSTTPAGTYPITFTFQPARGAAVKTVVLTLTISAIPDFTLLASPTNVTVPAGGTATVSVTATGANGFASPITVSASAISGVTISPEAFTLTPGQTQTVTITTSPTATPATVPLVFTGTAPGVSGARTAQVLLSISERAPALLQVAPTAVATGTKSRTIRFTAANLRPGATITTTRTDVIIEDVTILADNLAEIVLTVRPDAAPGPIPFVAINPGNIRSNLVSLNVLPASSLGAPISVSAAAIVFPASGTSFTAKDAVYPRGLLATTGTGAITGTWLLDGVPFDRFVITVGGGMPAEVRAHVPIPWGILGSHRLELAIDSPQQAISPEVLVIMSSASVSRLMLFAPLDGTVATADTLFRWSLVPNASGYLVEFERGGRIRLSDAQWQPTARDIASLRGGIRRWRVRPIFAGETEGEPTEWRRVALLPDSVVLRVERPVATDAGVVVKWNGGTTGLIYRVDVIDASGNVLSSALTAAETFTLRSMPQGSRIRVTAIGPGGVVLGKAESPSSNAALGHEFRYVQSNAVSVTSQTPTQGATIEEVQPRIAASWSGAVRSQQIALSIDGVDVTAVAEVGPLSIVYDSLLPLEPGLHQVQLTLGETVSNWQFRIAAPQQAQTPEGVTPSEPSQPGTATPAGPGTPGSSAPTTPRIRRDWAIAPTGTITTVRSDAPGARDETRAQISANTDIATQAAGVKLNGDVAVRHDLEEPRQTVQESRSWVTSFTGRQGPVSEELRAGYAVPQFLDQSELMTLGAARGGISATVNLPGVRGSYYQTFSSRPSGVVAGNFGPQQKVRAMALQLPQTSRWDLRLLALNVDEQPGEYTSGGSGRSLGIFSRYTFSPLLAVSLEAARGSFDTRGGVETEGNAFRLGFMGSRGSTVYTLNLRRTDGGYTNPANRGFTPGAVADRTGGDLLVSHLLGRAAISVQLRHLQDGNSSGVALPRTKESGALVSLSMPLTSKVTLSLSGNSTKDKGEGNENLFLPETDRRQNSLSATFSESLGLFSFSQTFIQQQMKDRVSSLNDQTIRTATLSAAGTVTPAFTLSALLSGTRSEGSFLVGDTEVLLASLQPSFTVSALQLTLQPRATWSRTELSIAALETQLEQYQMVVMWAPNFYKSFASIQIAADWNRTRVDGQPVPDFDRRYTGALSLRWGVTGGNAAAAAPVVLPPEMQNEPYSNNTPLTSSSQ